jgi:hypothetical protein
MSLLGQFYPDNIILAVIDLLPLLLTLGIAPKAAGAIKDFAQERHYPCIVLKALGNVVACLPWLVSGRQVPGHSLWQSDKTRQLLPVPLCTA